jgi:chromosome segregation ATPase
MKPKDNLGCDEVVLSVEIFTKYGTAQKYVESLRAENTAQALLIVSLKEERDRLVALDKESKAALDKFNRQLMRDNAILGARVGELTQQLSDTQRQNAELKESIAQKNSDISSWIERDFSNQRKIADLMQRVGEAEKRIDKMCEMLESADPYRSVYDLMLIIKSALAASKVSNEVDKGEDK